MGLRVDLSIHQFDDGTVFDVDKVNAELMANTSFGELYYDFTNLPTFVGPFKMNGSVLKIANNWDSDFGGYANTTMVWGCYGDDVFQTIANNISAGKIVFFVEIEGNPNEFYVCEPGVFKKIDETTIKF